MKNMRIILWLSLISLIFSGCRTIDKKGAMLATMRDELDKKEQWRHTLPEENQVALKPAFPAVKTSKLKNGLTIMVVEDRRLPIASISLVTKNGSAKDPFGMSGLMHLTGLMLKEGTQTRTSLELAEDFANLGTEVSVTVGKDMANISAAVLSDKVDHVINYLGAMVKTPRMAIEDFERVKLQHQSLLASQQGVLSYVAQTSFLLAAYGEKHPYAYPSAGTVAAISKLNIEDIKKSHQANFGPNVAALIAVGDVSLEQIEALAKQHLGTWNRKATSLATVKDPPTTKRMQTRLVVRAHSPQTYLLLGQPVIAQKDKDLAALQVLQNIIAGAPTSRLDAKLREEKGWTYGVSSGVSPLLGKGPIMIATSVQVPFGADALNEILRAFDQLQKEPVTGSELATAKNGLLHSFAGRFSTVGKVTASLAERFIYGLPANYDEVIFDKIAQVSAEDIMAVSKRVLKKDTIVAVAVGDLEAIEEPIAKSDVGNVTIERETMPAGN